MKIRLTIFIALATALVLPPAIEPAAAQQPAAVDMITNGDVNGDGVFDIFDIMHLERTVSLGMEAKGEELSAGDVDGNGRLDKYDLLVLKDALVRVSEGEPMFNAVKESIESDLSKTKDNVETYLDLAKFYNKEQNFSRSRAVLESILEALETDHPLYNKVFNQLSMVKQEEMHEQEAAEDYENTNLYETPDNMAGKTSLRSKVLQLKGKLSKLMDDQQFGAHYNGKRVKSQLGNVMDDMLRKINQDQMVDATDFDQFSGDVRGVLENPENIIKQLDTQQRSRINDLVDTSTKSMRQEAIKLKQDFQRTAQGNAAVRAGAPSMGDVIFNRNERRMQDNISGENMMAQGRVPANAPKLIPDTVSIVSPQYTLTWDVSNILGAKNAALEISKPNTKFSNPRGTAPDKDATYFYTPDLGTVSGERRNSAIGLEGVGRYQFRVAALNSKGELISRFSDASELVVVYNNLDIAATVPQVEPKIISPDNPDYTFRWDVSNIEGARDAAVEVSKPDISFGNPNGRARDRINSSFFNPSLGRISGMFSSSISGLSGPGKYLFRVIAISSAGDFMGKWSDPATLLVTKAGAETPPAPSPVQQDTVRAPLGTPPTPTVRDTKNGFNVNWNVSEIKGATGVNFELARLRGDNDSTADEVDEVIIAEVVDSTLGHKSIDSGLLDQTGRYQARVAAVDSAGNLLTNWSKPALMAIQQEQTISPGPAASAAPQPQMQPAPEAGQVAAKPAQPKESGNNAKTAAAGDSAKSTPKGKTLEISRNNTPLYEQNNPSSAIIATLQKGEKLIRVGGDGLWQNVFYPPEGKSGWVVSFSVTPLD